VALFSLKGNVYKEKKIMLRRAKQRSVASKERGDTPLSTSCAVLVCDQALAIWGRQSK
jgi:hypothetical protein